MSERSHDYKLFDDDRIVDTYSRPEQYDQPLGESHVIYVEGVAFEATRPPGPPRPTFAEALAMHENSKAPQD